MSDEIKKTESEEAKVEATPALSEQQLDEAVGGTKPAPKPPVDYLKWKFNDVA
jgi:hypothetical protein